MEQGNKQVTESQEKMKQDRICPEEYAVQLNGLLEISNLVGSVLELDDILRQIVQLTRRMFASPTCSIYLFGPQRENLTLRAAAGHSQSEVGKRKLPIGKGIPGVAAQENKTIVVDNLNEDARHTDVYGRSESFKNAYICSPLRIQEEVVGVMTSRRYGGRTFSEDDRTVFETISKQVAIVIEKSKMYYDKLEADRLAAISISLSEVAHYIKNLLQGMKGGIYFVDHGLKQGDLEAARKGWEVLQRGNKKIASLVENMLNYSREMELQFHKTNLNSLLFEILHQIDDSAVERKVALIPEVQRDLPEIEVDADKLYDALLNLITNAIDAIPPGRDDGYVVVSTRWESGKDFVVLKVQDNGAGMTEETKRKLFNLFFSTKGDKGSGIGLSVTRKIIEKHGGRIDVESEPDKGATFTLLLPVKQEEEKTIETDLGNI